MTSLYLPRVFTNISKEEIMQVIESHDLGKVSHIDFIQKEDGQGRMYHTAYVHFEYWSNSTNAIHLQARLEAGERVKIVYSAPYFWYALKNHSKKKERQAVIEVPKSDVIPDTTKADQWLEICEIEINKMYRAEQANELMKLLEDDVSDDSFGDFDETFGLVDEHYASQLEQQLALSRAENDAMQHLLDKMHDELEFYRREF